MEREDEVKGGEESQSLQDDVINPCRAPGSEGTARCRRNCLTHSSRKDCVENDMNNLQTATNILATFPMPGINLRLEYPRN